MTPKTETHRSEEHVASVRRRTIGFWIAVVVFVTPVITGIWLDEPYPSPIGPHFRNVPDNGREWLVERYGAFVELEGGARKTFSLRSLSGGHSHCIAQSWLQKGKFQSPQARAWLSRKIRGSRGLRRAKALVVWRNVQTIDKQTRKRGEQRRAQELRISL